MIGFIERLRAALDEKAQVKIVAEKKPSLRLEPIVRESVPTEPKALAAHYAKYYLVDEQLDCLKTAGFGDFADGEQGTSFLLGHVEGLCRGGVSTSMRSIPVARRQRPASS